MENTQTPPPINNIAQVTPPTPLVKHWDSEELLKALYWIWDAFERSNMPFFLIGSTAESAIANRELQGDKVTVGVRKVEWISGARRIFEAFAIPDTEENDTAYFTYEGVPVELRIFADNPYITSPDMVRYKYEEFKVPNPYAKFKELYG